MVVDVRGTLPRIKNARDKALWGLRVVGPSATITGAARLARLRWRRPTQARVRVRSGFELEFSYPDQVPVALVAFGDLIDPEYPFLRAVAAPDWTVVDVGAAIGQFSVFAARLPCARVLAYEPSVANLVTLNRNASLNGVRDVVDVHTLALSDHEGRATFATSGHTWVSGLARDGALGGDPVPVRRLDAELQRQGIERVELLKINVAGYEPEVLDGADAFLARGGADVMVLLLGLQSFDRYARLASYGYRFFFFHPGRGELHEVTAFDDSLLKRRPWPARHILAMHQSAIAAGLTKEFRLC